jgi:phospholipid/cholesterol/gamma-HCH transport system substrate-binding protein
MVAAGFILYALYARGTFEATQRLTLVSDNAEGVSLGMDLTFSGFPIGRVVRISLADDGPRAHRAGGATKGCEDGCASRASSPWSAASSGGADPGFQRQPAGPAAARRGRAPGAARRHPGRDPAHGGDAEEHAREHRADDRPGGSLQASLGNLRTSTERLGGRHGALGAVLGNDEDAKKVVAAIETRECAPASMSGVVAKTDQRVLGPGGVVEGTQRAVNQANDILGELRESLKRVRQDSSPTPSR